MHLYVYSTFILNQFLHHNAVDLVEDTGASKPFFTEIIPGSEVRIANTQLIGDCRKQHTTLYDTV